MNCVQLLERYVDLRKEPSKNYWKGECAWHDDCSLMVTEHAWLCSQGLYGDAADYFIRAEGLPTDCASAIRLWQVYERDARPLCENAHDASDS